MSKRGIRIHHHERLKKNRKNYWGGNLSDKHNGMVADTPKICSCWMCGNARKIWGKSISEIRDSQKKLHED